MSSPASYSPSSGHSGPSSPSSRGSTTATRALAVVTNRWYREQRRADQDTTRTLTLLKQRKISCILKVENLRRVLGRDVGEGVGEVERELQEVERKMSELEREREERCRRIMDRRVQQVTTLQELGLLEAAGKESNKWRSESDLKEGLGLLAGYSPGCSPTGTVSTIPPASRKLSPSHLGARLRAGSDPTIARPDPASRLEPSQLADSEKISTKGLAYKLSPRIGRRNPLRMLSNAIDFRSRRKQRPKSADFDLVEVEGGSEEGSRQTTPHLPPTPRSASVTDILESVSLSPGPRAPSLRVLEGRNSAPDMLTMPGAPRGPRSRTGSRLSAAASAKQKLSTRFQPQRKLQHRGLVVGSSSVRRAKTFSLGGPGPGHPPAGPYKTLPKQASSRSLGSSSTDSSTGSQSTASSRKSSNSSNLSSEGGGARGKAISKDALDEIAAFEKFIEEYFESCDNNNLPPIPLGPKVKQKVSTASGLSEVLELSI